MQKSDLFEMQKRMPKNQMRKNEKKSYFLLHFFNEKKCEMRKK